MIFQVGGRTPYPLSGSAHAYDRSTRDIQNFQVFSKANPEGQVFSCNGSLRDTTGETQLVMLMEDLSRNAIKGQQTDLILLDFSKAFDKVSHEKLLLGQV